MRCNSFTYLRVLHNRFSFLSLSLFFVWLVVVVAYRQNHSKDAHPNEIYASEESVCTLTVQTRYISIYGAFRQQKKRKTHTRSIESTERAREIDSSKSSSRFKKQKICVHGSESLDHFAECECNISIKIQCHIGILCHFFFNSLFACIRSAYNFHLSQFFFVTKAGKKTKKKIFLVFL